MLLDSVNFASRCFLGAFYPIEINNDCTCTVISLEIRHNLFLRHSIAVGPRSLRTGNMTAAKSPVAEVSRCADPPTDISSFDVLQSFTLGEL